LAKLVTPPLWTSDLNRLKQGSSSPTTPFSHESADELSIPASGQTTAAPSSATTRPTLKWNDPRVLRAVPGIWLAGAGIVLVLAACRAVRFGRFLRHARPAPEALQDRANALA